MNKLLALGYALALTSIACGSSNDGSNTGTNTNTSTGTNTGTGACVGANSNSLVGGCSMMGQCFEEYAPAAPTAAIVKAINDACTSAGGTFAATGCALATVACTCTETQSSYKMITYWDDATYCSDCTGNCKSVK